MSSVLWCLVLAWAAAPPVETSAEATTHLYVRTTPSGAQILLDGEELGTSPGVFPVKPGQRRRLVIELDGQVAKEQQITIRDGRITRIELTLTAPEPGAASESPPDVKVESRSVGKKISDFPETVDLSTPESACAAFHRACAAMDADAVVDLCWVTIDPREMRLWTSGKLDGLATYNKAQLEAEILKVLSYKKELAAVVSRLEFPPGASWPPISLRTFGRIDGKWKNLGEDGCSSLEVADTIFSEIADQHWQSFQEIRKTLAVAPSAMRPSARKPRPTVDQPLAFGPVIEQVLEMPKGRKGELLDLDTGRRAVIDKFGEDDRETHRRIREQGVDVSAGVEHGVPGALLFDAVVVEISSDQWETITTKDVVDNWHLKQQEPPPITTLVSPDVSKLPLTCLFETREGSLGVFQLVGAADAEKGTAKIRYKLVVPEDAARAAAPSAGAGSAKKSASAADKTLSFGPVIERVVNDKDSKLGDFLIDFDTGEVFSPPVEELKRTKRSLAEWTNEVGVDGIGDTRSRGLIGCNMIFGPPVLGGDWNGISPNDVVQGLGPDRPRRPVRLHAKGDLPATFIFQTRHGAKGILQILGFVEEPPAVKIRYKLVQSGGDEAALREVISKFVQAVRQRDVQAAVTLFTHKMRSGVDEQLSEARECIAAGLKMGAIEKVHIGQNRALVVTQFARFRDPKYKEPVCTVYCLSKHGTGWAIADIDVEDEHGLADEIRRFRETAQQRGVDEPGEREEDVARAAAPMAGVGSAKKPASAAGKPVSFGPVIEHVVNDGDLEQDAFFIDFDTGQLLLAPPDSFRKPTRRSPMLQLADFGIDALGGTKADTGGLTGNYMFVTPIPSDKWDRISPNDVAEGVGVDEPGPVELISFSGKGDPPATFIFKTHQGAMGVLRIARIAEKPGGVKIRYKLVDSGREKEEVVILTYEVDPDKEHEIENLLAAVRRRLDRGWVGRADVRQADRLWIKATIYSTDPEQVRRIERHIQSPGTIEFRILANERDHKELIERAQKESGPRVLNADGTLAAWWVPLAEGHWTLQGVTTRGIEEDGPENLEVLVVEDPFDVTDAYLLEAVSAEDPSGKPSVGFTFDSRGGQLLGGLTGANLPDNSAGFSRHLGIILNGRLRSFPAIRSTIRERGEITGNFTREEVDDLVSVLNTGPLPMPLDKLSEVRTSQ